MLMNTDYSIDIFNDELSINTWENWHLAPKERPSVAPPEVKTEYVEIPGANGSLDYTEVLAGEVRYGNRTGSWNFIVENGYQQWYSLYDEIRTTLHGKKFNCVLREQPNYVYTGRLEVEQWKSEKNNSTIAINYNFAPFKTIKEGTIEDWKWDDLTFDTDVYIIYFGRFVVSSSLLRNFYNPLDKEVEVSLTVSDTMRVSMGGLTTDGSFYPDPGRVYTFNAGTYEHTGIMLTPFTNPYLEGNNILLFEGNGSVTVTYDRGVSAV